MNDSVVHRRQLLAWFVLLLCGALFVLTIVAIPVGARLYRQRATLPMATYLSASAGRLILNKRTPLDTATARDTIDLPASIEASSPFDAGLVEFFDRTQETRLATITIANERTNLRVIDAIEPRFEGSTAASEINIQLNQGRIRVRVLGDAPPNLSVKTAYGTVETSGAGDFSFEASEAGMTVSVLELDGQANLFSEKGVVPLLTGERRSVAPDAIISEPLSTSRSLLTNGSFEDGENGLANWIEVSNSADEGQPISYAAVSDGNILEIRRDGVGHADVEFRQVINRDVRNFSDLRLLLNVRIWKQSLDVCGFVGTECPITIRLYYEDEAGRDSQWHQGLYVTGEPSDQNPPFCTTCDPLLGTLQHERLNRVGEEVVYESADNLMERMALEDTSRRPARINALGIIAAGHSFEVDIVDIALIASE